MLEPLGRQKVKEELFLVVGRFKDLVKRLKSGVLRGGDGHVWRQTFGDSGLPLKLTRPTEMCARIAW